MIRILTVLAILMGGGGAAAAPYLYECDMTDIARGRGWISPKIAVVLPGDGTVKIVDSVILSFRRGALKGTLLRDSPSRLIVKWTVRDVRAENGRSFAHFDYRASISKASGVIDLTASPREFDTGLRSLGKCSRRTE